MGLLEGGHKSIFSAFIHKLTNYPFTPERPFKLHLLFLVNVSRLKSRVAYVANFKKKSQGFLNSFKKPRDISSIVDVVLV